MGRHSRRILVCTCAGLVFLAQAAFATVLLQHDFTSAENGTLPSPLSGEWDAGVDLKVVALSAASPVVPSDHTGGDGYGVQIGDLGAAGYNFVYPLGQTAQSDSQIEAWAYFAFDSVTVERDYFLVAHASLNASDSFYDLSLIHI